MSLASMWIYFLLMLLLQNADDVFKVRHFCIMLFIYLPPWCDVSSLASPSILNCYFWLDELNLKIKKKTFHNWQLLSEVTECIYNRSLKVLWIIKLKRQWRKVKMGNYTDIYLLYTISLSKSVTHFMRISVYIILLSVSSTHVRWMDCFYLFVCFSFLHIENWREPYCYLSYE